MSIEAPQAPEAPNATELQTGAPAAAPADGVASPENLQQTQDNANGEGDKPEHRKAAYRFSEMSKQLRESERRAAFLEGQLEALRLQNSGAPQPPAPQPEAQVAQDLEPDPEAYPGKAYDPKYLRDVAAWEGRREARALQEKAAKAAEEERQAQAQRAEFEKGRERFFEARSDAEAIEEQFPQYSGVATRALDDIARAEPAGTPGRLIDIITRAENRAWVGTYLATNPQVLREIAQMDPVNRAYAIGKIDARISANLQGSPQPAPAAQPSAAAPAPAAAQPPAQPAPSNTPQVQPPAHLNGRAATPSLDPRNARDMEEYIAARKAQMGLN